MEHPLVLWAYDNRLKIEKPGGSMYLTPGTVIGSCYQVIQFIGEGGMGQVYSARDVELGRTVAVKILSHSSLVEQESRDRFVREGRLLSQLSHPNIIRFFKFGEYSSAPYIAMEYVKGKSLSSLLAEHGPREPHEVLELLGKLASALDEVHAVGVVHRDLKPANVIVEESGEPKLIDFGLAKAEDNGKLTNTGTLLGTANYMSPEQCMGQKADARSDLYSFGCLAFECLTGSPPFEGEPLSVIYRHVNEAPRSVNFAIADTARAVAVDSVFAKALSKMPGDRYDSARELFEGLKLAITEGESESTRPELAVQRAGKPVAIALLGAVPVIVCLMVFHTNVTSAAVHLLSAVAGKQRGAEACVSLVGTLDRVGLRDLAIVFATDVCSSGLPAGKDRVDLLLYLAERQEMGALSSLYGDEALEEMSRLSNQEEKIGQLRRLRNMNLSLPLKTLSKLQGWQGSAQASAEALEVALKSVQRIPMDERAQLAWSLCTIYERIDSSENSSKHLSDCVRVLEQTMKAGTLPDRLRLLVQKGILYQEYGRIPQFQQVLKQIRDAAGRLQSEQIRTTDIAYLLASVSDVVARTGNVEQTVLACETAANYLNCESLISTKQGAEIATNIVLALVTIGSRDQALRVSERFYATASDSDCLKLLLVCADYLNGGNRYEYLCDQITAGPILRFLPNMMTLLEKALVEKENRTGLFKLATKARKFRHENALYFDYLFFSSACTRNSRKEAVRLAESIMEEVDSGERDYMQQSYFRLHSLGSLDKVTLVSKMLAHAKQLPIDLQRRLLALGKEPLRELSSDGSVVARKEVYKFGVAAYPVLYATGRAREAKACVDGVLNQYDFFTHICPDADLRARCFLLECALKDHDLLEARRQAEALRERSSYIFDKEVRALVQCDIAMVESAGKSENSSSGNSKGSAR